jgi:hypothetical protein
MKAFRKWDVFGVLALAAALTMVAMSSAWAVEITVSGTVTEDLQLVTDDGALYELIDEEYPIPLEVIGKSVQITGVEETEGEMKLLRVVELIVFE